MFATPQIVRVDGSIFDATGAPTTASKDIQIKAYDAATGGTLLWTSDVYTTAVNTARFTINMDAASGSIPSLVSQIGSRTSAQGIYFQIEVDSGAANGSMDSATIVLPRIRAKGTMFALNAAQADSLKGVTASVAELNHLSGVTAAVQSQLNTLAAGGSASARVAKVGDSMSGALEVGSTITATGNVSAASFLTGVTGQLRLRDTGTNTLSLRAPDSLAGNLVWTLPSANGGNGQVMKFDSSTKAFYWDNDAGASGGVSGPGASTSNALARWNGTAGTTVKDSSIVLDDGGNLSGVSNLVSTGTVTAYGLNLSGASNGSRFVLLDSSKNLVSSASSVTDTEFGYLSGVTSNMAAKLNSVSATDMSRLAGVTAGVQTQINSINATVSGLPTNSTALLKAGDTMTGDLGLSGSQATASRALILDASRRVASSAVTSMELGYLSGVTALTKVNSFTATEAGYLSGVTQAIQTQLNAKATAANHILKAGDTMTGDLGLAGSQATASRALILDSSRRVSSSSVTDTELGFLSGVTSSLTKANSFTATEATYLSGVTSNIGAKINNFTATEAGYLSGVTNSIQTQLNSISPMSTSIITSSTAAAVNNAYFTNSASLVGVTLPSNCAVGDRIKVAGLGTGGWKIIQQASQTIDYSGDGDSTNTGSVTTSGTGGYLQSLNSKAAVEITCRVANTGWQVTGSDGEYTGDYLAGVSTFTSNGSLTIPTNVRMVTLKAWGGGGGGAGGISNSSAGGGGGGGAFASRYLAVKPGDVLTVVVGTGGGGAASRGGGGGGWTAVRSGPSYVLIAGGGGGGGAGSGNTGARPGGGGGGGVCTGTGNGVTGSGGGAPGTYGSGATSYSGGAAGASNNGSGTASSAGAENVGGDGYGAAGGAAGTPNGGRGGSGPNMGGGGGGGGIYGGGGGGGSSNTNSSAGGGGGGSSSGATLSCTDGGAGSGTTAGTAGGSGDADYGGGAAVGGAGGAVGNSGSAGSNGRVVIKW